MANLGRHREMHGYIICLHFLVTLCKLGTLELANRFVVRTTAFQGCKWLGIPTFICRWHIRFSDSLYTYKVHAAVNDCIAILEYAPIHK